MTNQPDQPGRPHMEEMLTRLDAVYTKYGRDGLKEFALADVSMLLVSKELEFRDAPKGRDLHEHEKASNRRLELQIRDLTGYLNGQLATAGLSGSRVARLFGSQPRQDADQQDRSKQKTRDYERDR